MLRLPVALVDLALRLAVRPVLARTDNEDRARRRFERHTRLLFRRPRGVAVEQAEIAATGRPVPALRMVPPGAQGALLYLHGGGYVLGSPRTHAHIAARLARDARLTTLVPDYSLAPERPFPAAVEDTLACYRALLAEGHPPGRIGVAGDSAGGGLAAGLVLSAARAGLAPPGCLLLFSPWVDLTGGGASLSENAGSDAMLPPERMPDVVGRYLAGADPADPLASPLMGRFVAPPPALIFASRHEILRDDAIRLAARLKADGGQVHLVLRPHLPHAWPVFAGWLAAADIAVAESAGFLRRHLGAGAL